MTLTPAGEILTERARRALLELERARAEIRPDRGPVQGIVTIGLLESTVEILAAPLLESVARQHPGVELRLLSAFSGHLQQWLDDGDVDMTLLYNLESTPSIFVTPLLHESLWAVAPPGAALGADALTWKHVAEQPLVLPVAGHGLRVLIDEALHITDVEPTVVCQTNSMLLQKRLVASGSGWSVLPAAGVAGDVAAGRLERRPADRARGVPYRRPRPATERPGAGRGAGGRDRTRPGGAPAGQGRGMADGPRRRAVRLSRPGRRRTP